MLIPIMLFILHGSIHINPTDVNLYIVYSRNLAELGLLVSKMLALNIYDFFLQISFLHQFYSVYQHQRVRFYYDMLMFLCCLSSFSWLENLGSLTMLGNNILKQFFWEGNVSVSKLFSLIHLLFWHYLNFALWSSWEKVMWVMNRQWNIKWKHCFLFT